ncbi:MAG: SDR family NAD(P)-dependent oxidoreductase [Leptospira sp.]|nr:SDR family NAD(P)-dependent oxidoreductase [Leptospira sp.]NCS95548.1 SDR family NAD(P)-dependent oxidoreductase [Leptospira sp.]
MNSNFWKGKTVLITGASSGIGEAIFHRLDGIASTIYLLSRNPKITQTKKTKDSKQDITSAIKNKNEQEHGSENGQVKSELISIACDLSKSDQVEKALKSILKSNPSGIDVIFNNAGITAHGRFESTKMDVFRQTFETNFFGPIRLIQGLVPELVKVKGVVISTSTVSALYGVPGRAAYSSSKSAVHAAMESFRIEMSEQDVRSILVCVPYTKTKLRQSGLDADGSILQEEQASGKIKTAYEVALSILEAVENPKSKLVTIDKSGFAMKLLRLISPNTLEKIMFKKLYKDFH